METDADTIKYHGALKATLEQMYSIANKARSQNIDPSSQVEALPAGDLAARVEGLVGPAGIAEKIRSIGRENIPKIIDSILEPEKARTQEEMESQIDQAVRTSLAIQTEGVS